MVRLLQEKERKKKKKDNSFDELGGDQAAQEKTSNRFPKNYQYCRRTWSWLEEREESHYVHRLNTLNREERAGSDAGMEGV